MTATFEKFEEVLCIGRPDNLERRAHIHSEFCRVNLENYQFVDALNPDSEAVLALFASDFVKKYPPCFRCGQNACECENKCLFPAQVANWLSHMKAWQHVAIHDSSGLVLLCEDDVKFTDCVDSVIEAVFESTLVGKSLADDRPVLVRLGWAWCADHLNDGPPQLVNEVKMSNPCYAINQPMARSLLNSLTRIETTSDIYVHRVVGTKADHYTAMPPAAYELSWSTGELRSEIRPKKRRIQYLQDQLGQVDPREATYKRLQREIEEEERAIHKFDALNAKPGSAPFAR